MDRRKRGRGEGKQGAQPGEGVKTLASWSCRGGFMTNGIVSPGPQSRTWDQVWARSHADSATQGSEVPIHLPSKEGFGYLEKRTASSRETLDPWARTSQTETERFLCEFPSKGKKISKERKTVLRGKRVIVHICWGQRPWTQFTTLTVTSLLAQPQFHPHSLRSEAPLDRRVTTEWRTKQGDHNPSDWM